MYCNQCGKKIPGDAKFCHHCGSVVGTEQRDDPMAAQQEKKSEVSEIKKEKKECRKKVAVALGNKHLLIVVAAAVVVIGAIVGVVTILCSQKVVAELPDPEYYYSSVSIDEVEESDGIKRVIIRSDEDLWELAAGYVNLVKWSGKYPVTQSYEEQYSNGDYTWQFVYSNTDEIKSPYFCQIEVNYYKNSSYRHHYAVWVTIHDTDAFDLVQRERYGVDETSETEAGSSSSADETQPSVDYSDVGSSDDGSSTVSDSDSSQDDDDNDYEVPEISDIYDTKTPCGVCNRSGDCQTCGGDGYLMSSASDEEDRNCYSCNGRGSCRSCGGDGWLD